MATIVFYKDLIERCTEDLLAGGDLHEVSLRLKRVLEPNAAASEADRAAASALLKHMDAYEQLTGLAHLVQADDEDSLRQAASQIEEALRNGLEYAINRSGHRKIFLREAQVSVHEKLAGAVMSRLQAQLDLIKQSIDPATLDTAETELEKVLADPAWQDSVLPAGELEKLQQTVHDIQKDVTSIRETARLTSEAVAAAEPVVQNRVYDQYPETLERLQASGVNTSDGRVASLRETIQQTLDRIQQVNKSLLEANDKLNEQPRSAASILAALRDTVQDLDLDDLTRRHGELVVLAEARSREMQAQALALLHEGQTQAAARQWQPALNALERAARLDPDNKEIGHALGEARLKQQRYSDLLMRVNQAVEKFTQEKGTGALLSLPEELLQEAESFGIDCSEVRQMQKLACNYEKEYATVKATSKLLNVPETTPDQLEVKHLALQDIAPSSELTEARARYREAYRNQAAEKLREYVKPALGMAGQMKYAEASNLLGRGCELWQVIIDEPDTWGEMPEGNSLAIRLKIARQQRDDIDRAAEWWTGEFGQQLGVVNQSLEGQITLDNAFIALQKLYDARKSLADLPSGVRFMLGECDTFVGPRQQIRACATTSGSFILNNLNERLSNQFDAALQLLRTNREADAEVLCDKLDSDIKRLQRVLPFVKQEYPGADSKAEGWAGSLQLTRDRVRKAVTGRASLADARKYLEEGDLAKALAAIDEARSTLVADTALSEITRLEQQAAELDQCMQQAFAAQASEDLDAEIAALRIVLQHAPMSQRARDRLTEVKDLLSKLSQLDADLKRYRALLEKQHEYQAVLDWCDQQLPQAVPSEQTKLKNLRMDAERARSQAMRVAMAVEVNRKLLAEGKLARVLDDTATILQSNPPGSIPDGDRAEIAELNECAKKAQECFAVVEQALRQDPPQLEKARLELEKAQGVGGNEYQRLQQRLALAQGVDAVLSEVDILAPPDDAMDTSRASNVLLAFDKVMALRNAKDLSRQAEVRVRPVYERLLRVLQQWILNGRQNAASNDVTLAIQCVDAMEKVGIARPNDRPELERQRVIAAANDKLMRNSDVVELRQVEQQLEALLKNRPGDIQVDEMRRQIRCKADKQEADDLRRASQPRWDRIVDLLRDATALDAGAAKTLLSELNQARVESTVVSVSAAVADFDPDAADVELAAVSDIAGGEPKIGDLQRRSAEMRAVIQFVNAAVEQPTADGLREALHALDSKVITATAGMRLSTGKGMIRRNELKALILNQAIKLAERAEENTPAPQWWQAVEAYRVAIDIRPDMADLLRRHRDADRAGLKVINDLQADLSQANVDPNETAAQCQELYDRVLELPKSVRDKYVDFKDGSGWLLKLKEEVTKADRLMLRARRELSDVIPTGQFAQPLKTLEELCAINDRFNERDDVRRLRSEITRNKSERDKALQTQQMYQAGRTALGKIPDSSQALSREDIGARIEDADRNIQRVMQTNRAYKAADSECRFGIRQRVDGLSDPLDKEYEQMEEWRRELGQAADVLAQSIRERDEARKLIQEARNLYEQAHSSADDEGSKMKAVQVQDRCRAAIELGEQKLKAILKNGLIGLGALGDEPLGISRMLAQVGLAVVAEVRTLNQDGRVQQGIAEQRIDATADLMNSLLEHYQNAENNVEIMQLGVGDAEAILLQRGNDQDAKRMRDDLQTRIEQRRDEISLRNYRIKLIILLVMLGVIIVTMYLLLKY